MVNVNFTSTVLDPSFWDHPTPTIVEWLNQTQSLECSSAQGLVTNCTDSKESTHFVWLSCKTFIARGRFAVNKLGYIENIQLDAYNYQALDGPNSDATLEIVEVADADGDPEASPNTNTTLLFGHIGDGDYVRTGPGAPDEVWFGLEGAAWPRRITAGLVRFNAETLEYLGASLHPTVTTMPWLAFDKARGAAYSANWTDNDNALIVFNATTMAWSDAKIPICNVPAEFEASGLQFIQGGTIDNVHVPHPNPVPKWIKNLRKQHDKKGSDDDENNKSNMTDSDSDSDSDDEEDEEEEQQPPGLLYLQLDDYRSTLLTLKFHHQQHVGASCQDGGGASILDAWHTGLGYEREGLALTQKQLLSLGNRHDSWEGFQHAEIVALHFPKMLHTKDKVEVGGGIAIGLLIAMVLSCLSCVCQRMCCRKKTKKEYDSSESAGLTAPQYQDGVPSAGDDDDDLGTEDRML